MLQICSNGRSAKVNKRPRRGNKRMWFLIKLKEERRGELVNPSFIRRLRPLVCLLHNVVFKKGEGEEWGRTQHCFPPNEMSTDLTTLQTEPGVFRAFCQFYCSLSFAAHACNTPPTPHRHTHPLLINLLFLLFLFLHLFEASFSGISALKITKGWGNNWVCAITASLMRVFRSLSRSYLTTELPLLSSLWH